MATFPFQSLLLLWLIFEINCIFIGLLFIVTNQSIHLDVILTLAEFYSKSARVLKKRDLNDSIYFKRKKTRDLCFKIYIFAFSTYHV